jgi:hypothetical protein
VFREVYKAPLAITIIKIVRYRLGLFGKYEYKAVYD